MAHDSKPRSRRLWRGLAISLVTFVAAFGLAEIAHRIWRSASGWPYDAEKMRESFGNVLNRATQAVPLPGNATHDDDNSIMRQVLSPYAGFDSCETPPLIAEERKLREAANPNAFPIVVLGGSVSWIFARLGKETFVEALAQDPRLAGRQIVVLNHGRGGYKQPQQLNTLSLVLGLGFRPAAVVNIDGFNDVALCNDNAQNGIHPFFPSHSHWLHLMGSGQDDDEAKRLLGDLHAARARAARTAKLGLNGQLWRSSVLGTLLLRTLRSSLRNSTESQLAYVRRLSEVSIERGVSGPAFEGDIDDAMEIAVEGWAESSISLQAICAARGIPYLHVLQPTLHDDGSKPMTEEERVKGEGLLAWVEGVKKGYPLLRERGARLREQGVPFVDASRIFADVNETLYYDVCHFAERGNEIFARVVARELLAVLPADLR